MNVKNRGFILLITIGVVSLLLSALFGSVVYAGPPAQDTRPPFEPGGDGDGGGGGGGDDDNGGPSEPRCASVVGQVINWGFGPEAGVIVELKTGSWQVATTSATDGRYGLGGLGVGLARLNVSLAPGPAEQLRPMIQEAGVYLNCDFPTIANIGLASDSPAGLPASLIMSAPDKLTPGGTIPLRLTVQNNLPNEISQVIVTDLLPPGLRALEVTAASVEAENVGLLDGGPDGQLAFAYLDTLAAGAEANVFITVTPAEDTPPGAEIKNVATLFYRESVAVQAELDITIGRGAPVGSAGAISPSVRAEATPAAEAEAETSAAAPVTSEAEATPAAAEDNGETFVPPDDMPTTGENFVPPGLLPVTGQEEWQIPTTLPNTGLGLILPLSGIGLVSLAMLAHHLRVLNRRRE